MKILIIRLSAMGDVAMTVPVINALSSQYNNAQIILLTGKLFNPFFNNINNLTIINPDLKGIHKGFVGLFKLYKTIKEQYKPDIVIDLHSVLRSKILRSFFSLSGINVSKIKKGRKEKRQLTRKRSKKLKQLKHTIQRYADTFLQAGIELEINKEKFRKLPELSEKNLNLFKKPSMKIGIAPFAKHIQKQYPLDLTEKVIQALARRSYEIFIFGGGEKEQGFAKTIENSCKNVTSLVNEFSLKEEISLIDQMDLLITMDSANMHIASMTNTTILSVWGATHPFAGFTPFILDERSIIVQNEDLECRPCSVYGNKKCFKGTLECMYSIKPEQIVELCEQRLKESIKQP